MIKQVRFLKKSLRFHIRDDADDAVLREIFKEHEYKLCDKIIRKSKNAIIDVGAHIGIFAAYCRIFNTNVPIYCFEPDEDNFQLLKDNLKLNRFKDVRLSNTAVWKDLGQHKFYIHEDNINHSLVSKSDTVKTIQTTTLERVFQKYRIQTCDLLKIDAEGSEFDMLYSVSQNIFRKINAIYLEYHEFGNYKVHNLRDFLKKQGYTVTVYPAHYSPKMGIIFGLH